MSSEGSDIELHSALPKKIKKKAPKSPTEEVLNNQEPKKITTKDMINQALVDLRSRKGTSLYAIKKYIQEKYKVNVEKNNYIIKKSIKTGVENGSIVQTKGIGATGSFKLAPTKEKPKKAPKKNVEKSTKAPKADRPKKIAKDSKSSEKNDSQKVKKKVEIAKSVPEDKKEKSKKVTEKITSNEEKMKKSKAKMAKALQTPTKKRSAMMKRKSIGSIIKPPKMNPRKK